MGKRKALLTEATRLTGGSLLKPGQMPDLSTTRAVQYIEMWPPLVLALLLLFLLDVALRRWEHVQGIWEKGAGLVDFERLSTNCPRSAGLGFRVCL